MTDAEILEAYRMVASWKAFCGTGLRRAASQDCESWPRTDTSPQPATVTITLTGHGLKDPDTAVAQAADPATARSCAGVTRSSKPSAFDRMQARRSNMRVRSRDMGSTLINP